ncbi:MAG: 50S ribosomal protein L24 [Betaproteobacteria bacterium]|jgi:large subunit ribosomal protein L24|nr:50S ribosomal protein L24 [Betaproteobacteria bacterium]MBT5670852.1 50S ribosomal protein L24 [Betaproteobacteria bacterium]MBT7997725.1 50S ribosomal protein L24 [Betaproteobacteria bacterium]MDC1433025.1 50S ribosomal protein L24 [Burkholderiales bacterium]MDC3409260.1 50S ribosomal protein L24 [Burkholderiales bacterium]
MEKIRKGDQVIVTSGKDKGKQGTVLRMMTNSTVVVEGINLVKKHQKGNPMSGDAGGIITKEMPIQRSNLAVFNTVTQKGDRVGIKTLEDGSRARIFRSNGEMVDS